MQGDWDRLKKDYADTPNVVIGACDCTSGCEAKCGEYQVQGYPSLKLKVGEQVTDFNGGREYNSFKREVESKLNPRPACSLESKDACKKEDLAILEESEKMSKAERAAKIKSVNEEIKEAKNSIKELEQKSKKALESLDLWKAGGATVEKVEQLLNDEDWKAHCEGRTCIVSFLPHIYDDQAAGRNEHLKALTKAMQDSKKDGKDMGFLWSQGGDQFEMEEKLGLQFGYPAVIAVNFKKGVFGVHRGTLQQIGQFLISISTGKVPLAPIPAGAQAVKADPWDGKDAEMPVEEDL